MSLKNNWMKKEQVFHTQPKSKRRSDIDKIRQKNRSNISCVSKPVKRG